MAKDHMSDVSNIHCFFLCRALASDSDDEDLDSDILDYQFSTSKVWTLQERSVALLPYDPHDDQLEGSCKMIDGINSWPSCVQLWKDRLFYNVYATSLALLKDPSIVAPQKICAENQLWTLSFQPMESRKKW